MSDRLRVSEASDLMSFLISGLKGWSRNTIKQRLKTGCITVNGRRVQKHNHALVAGDNVEVLAAPKHAPKQDSDQLQILYSNNDLIAINKPPGLLSVATTAEKKNHALHILRDQLSSPRHSVKLWPVHRLDRDTSGVMLFSTSVEMREAVMNLWHEAEKTYLTIVEGHPDPASGTIEQPIWPDPHIYKMHVGAHPEAKPAITHYKTLRTNKNRALLEVRLDTGRQHQIRAHLSWLGYPVVGDRRYGKDGPRMGLHAVSLSIISPVTNKRIKFEVPAPKDFTDLIDN